MEDNLDSGERAEAVSLVPGYKSVCARLWLVMCVAFGVRIAAALLLKDWVISFKGDQRTLVEFAYSMVFLNIIPITASIFIMKFNVKEEAPRIYKKPKYFGRALGMFPAGYGISLFIAMATMLIISMAGGKNLLDQTVESFGNTTTASAWIEFFHAVILAPIFEEFWFRGIILQSMRPYGNGVAIFVSAVMFGLMHANFTQLFFTSAIGVVLAYTAIQTGSIYTSIAIHALFNTPASITRLFLSDNELQDKVYKMILQETTERDPKVVLFLVWTLVLCTVGVIGVIMGAVKLFRAKRYKVPKVQDEMTARRRWGILLTRLTIIPALLLIVYVFFNLSPEKIVKLFGG